MDEFHKLIVALVALSAMMSLLLVGTLYIAIF